MPLSDKTNPLIQMITRTKLNNNKFGVKIVVKI